MSQPVGYKRSRPRYEDVSLGVAARSRTHLPAAELANWLRGVGSVLVPASNVSITIAAGTTKTLRYRVKPIGTAVVRVWVIYARASAVTGASSLSVAAPTGATLTARGVVGTTEATRAVTFVEPLTAKSAAEQEISIDLRVVAGGASVLVQNVMCYEMPRRELLRDSTDRGIARETLLSREPVYDEDFVSLGGIMDAASFIDTRRRVTLFARSWPDNITDALSTTSGAALGTNLLTALPVPMLARKRYIGDVVGAVSPRYYVRAPVGTSMEIRCANGATTVDVTHAGTGAFAWVTSSADINVDCELMTASDGRQGAAWDELIFSWRRSVGAGTCYLANVSALDLTT